MNLLTKLVVAVGAAGLMASVQAETFDAGTLTPTVFEHTATFSELTTFEDIYNFTIADFQTLLASATGTNISGLSLSLFASADGSSLGSFSAGSGTQVDLSQNLLAGDYFLKVSGVADGSLGGQYQFSIEAVPEPAEWTMLLAGLAVLGFIARRKTSGLMAG